MSTKAKPSNNKGTSKAYANGSPQDVGGKLNVRGSTAIGVIQGRLTRSKSSVASLNTGEWAGTVRKNSGNV